MFFQHTKQKTVKFQTFKYQLVEQGYELKGLEELEPRDEGENEYVEAYSEAGDLEVRDTPEARAHVWETDAAFREQTEAVETQDPWNKGIQDLHENADGGLKQTNSLDEER